MFRAYPAWSRDVIQAPAETDGDMWVIRIADHHGAPVVSNDRFDEYRASFPWLARRAARGCRARRPRCFTTGRRARRQRPPENPAALREEIERHLHSAAAAHSCHEDVVALSGRVAHLEGRLAREQARSDEAQAEAERIGELLAEERHTMDALRQELRQFPSNSRG